VILAIVTCTGNKSIFVQWEPVAIPKNSSKIKLKVYVENSLAAFIAGSKMLV
jgi:hypothetical protein